MSDTILYCDRDAVRLANTIEPKPVDAVEEEADESTLADEIAALREELQNALTFLKSDFQLCLAATKEVLSGDENGE